MPLDPIAQRDHWKTVPMSDQQVTLPIEQTYNRAEMARIRRGLIPHEMEDKWFIFYEDDVLYFHRSWTGFCVYEAEFAAQEDGFAVTRLVANRDPEQYRETDDERDVASFRHLVRVLLID
jgi:hypothetical protein